tara:strand:+ start:297 stop:1169 length:873 start_codon:yes stop_codon:yes gene_type:complete
MDEPHLIDYYNTFPHGINVIDKMNEELDILQTKYNQLKQNFKNYRLNHTIITYPMPKIKVKDMDELKQYAQKIYNSVPRLKKIIYDFLNREGWILDYDQPNQATTGILGYSECGFWDTWEHDQLKWGDTTAQEFYYGKMCNTEYNIYLKCKILDELYKLFPNYTNRERGWFHKIIDKSFSSVVSTLLIITAMNGGRKNQRELHNVIYRIIMEPLFGWGNVDGHFNDTNNKEGIFPYEYMNEDYIQNIIYYQCNKCGKVFHGEDAMDYKEEDNDVNWYYENGKHCEEPCKC